MYIYVSFFNLMITCHMKNNIQCLLFAFRAPQFLPCHTYSMEILVDFIHLFYIPFLFFELVIIALLESRQSMWAAITLLVYITFLTKCVKCQTQNIVIILSNYICKWDFIVSIWMASKNLDTYPPRIWTELNLLCSESIQNKLTHFW